MKNIFRIAMLFTLLLSTAACSNSNDNKVFEEAALEASYINIAGTWGLTEWNGQSIETIYTYITFDRRERTFVMYQNMDSMYPRKITGSFSLSKDENDESIDLISGDYDYDNGKWNNTYEIKIYKEKMIWTVVGDASDVSVYTRSEERRVGKDC